MLKSAERSRKIKLKKKSIEFREKGHKESLMEAEGLRTEKIKKLETSIQILLKAEMMGSKDYHSCLRWCKKFVVFVKWGRLERCVNNQGLQREKEVQYERNKYKRKRDD